MVFAKGESGLKLSLSRLRSRFNWPRVREQRKPYIVPTGFGLVFSTIVFIILVFALGYANNILYLVAFLLVSVSLTSMYAANRNLAVIRFKKVYGEDLFANHANQVRVQLENTSADTAFAFSVFFHDHENSSGAIKDIAEIPARAEHTLELWWKPLSRGWQELSPVQVRSHYPFEFFRVWKTHRSSVSVLVFPEKKGSMMMPVRGGDKKNAGVQGLFRGHREYVTGDQVRRIDWKTSARHQKTLLRTFENPDSPSYDLNWADTQRLSDPEDRISQLALWVDLCEKQGTAYSLTLPGQFFPLNKGIQHYRQCLKALAELPFEEELS